MAFLDGVSWRDNVPLILIGLAVIAAGVVGRFFYRGYQHRTRARALRAQGIVSTTLWLRAHQGRTRPFSGGF